MNDIQNILIKNGCDAETIANVVNDFKKVAVKHKPLQSCIALTVLLKIVATQGSDDPNEQIKLFFELADCYDAHID